MRLEFLDRQDGFRGSGGSVRSRSDSGLFWWTILITVLVGLASFCWFFSIYVFAHPEKPLNYRLLKRLDKLVEVKEFSPVNVPAGSIEPTRDLYSRFYHLSALHLDVKNDILMRNFISNYKDEAPLYLTGTFEVLSARLLGDKDLVTSGCVLRARCVEFPNVDRFADEKICFSTIPLIYPEIARVREEGGEPTRVVMSAPQELNMEAELPLTPVPGSEIRDVAGLVR